MRPRSPLRPTTRGAVCTGHYRRAFRKPPPYSLPRPADQRDEPLGRRRKALATGFGHALAQLIEEVLLQGLKPLGVPVLRELEPTVEPVHRRTSNSSKDDDRRIEVARSHRA